MGLGINFNYLITWTSDNFLKSSHGMGCLCNYTCKDCNVNLFHSSHHVFQKLYLFVSHGCVGKGNSVYWSALQDVWGFLTFFLKALPNMRLFVEVTLGSNWRICMSGWIWVDNGYWVWFFMGLSWEEWILGLILAWVWFWWSVGFDDPIHIIKQSVLLSLYDLMNALGNILIVSF